MKEKLNNGNPPAHIVIVPLMAQGHIIPLIDLARLLAQGGATTVSFMTTPVNAGRIRTVIERIRNSGCLPIRFIQLRFPSAAETGLPDGCENFDLIQSENLIKPFLEALSSLSPQLESYLRRGSTPKPDCIIADSLNYWTLDVARKFGIPHLVFHGPSCFYIYCCAVLRSNRSRVLDEQQIVEDDFQVFELPEMPPDKKIQVMKAHVRRRLDSPDCSAIGDKIYAAEEAADGILINTFDDLEPWFIDSYKKKKQAVGKKVWTIGPLSAYNKDMEDRASRGNSSSVDAGVVLRWLDGRSSRKSVILVSFGSISRNSFPQMMEIGEALESSKIPFIWVVKEEADGDTHAWIAEFEKKTALSGNGLVIRGWAPQALILWHDAVGGFVTHCGWNSTLEAIAAGLPMVTWPRFGDQFLNERLVVDVLGIGVPLLLSGAKLRPAKVLAVPDEQLTVVRREDIEKAVINLMGGGAEADERRRRATDFGLMASKAMEDKGSSANNLKDLIHYASCRV